MSDIQTLDKEYVAHTYGRFDVAFVAGKGCHLQDESGKDYIDLGSGIGVTAFGVDDDVWVKAVTDQVHKLNHVSNLYYTQPQVELAQKICQKTGMKKVFFSNSGAESNECAIKAARKYSHDKYGEGRHTIVTLVNSFHGRTIATLSATGQDVFHQDFGPFVEGFIHTPANDLEAFKHLLDSNETICAVMLEPIQGEGGVMPLDKDFVEGVAKLAQAKDILVLVDEVQTGNGRTGKVYGYMNYQISPDIVSTAKGLAGGLPMGATMFNEKTEAVLGAGNHASTFGGNPICAAGAITIMDRLTDELLASVVAKGNYIKKELDGAPGVKSLSGFGLMLGIETNANPRSIIDACLQEGLVVLSAKSKIRLLPALNIPKEDLEKGIAILKKVIGDLANE